VEDYFQKLAQENYEKSRPHPVGRPPILTSELIERLCDLVIEGKSLAKAAVFSGISESTIYRWLALGRQDGAEPVYLELAERIGQAVEFSEFEALQTLRKASQEKQHWRVAAWILERRFPEKYGKKDLPPKDVHGTNPDEDPNNFATVA